MKFDEKNTMMKMLIYPITGNHFPNLRYPQNCLLLLILFLITLNPVMGDGLNWTQMGRNAMEEENYSAAIWYFDQAINSKENEIIANNNKGVALMRMGRCNESVTALKKAYSLLPNDPTQLLNLALAYACSGDSDTALASIDSAINSSPQKSELWTIKASFLLEEGMFQDALSAINTSITLNATDPAAWYEKSLILTQMNDYSNAYDAIKNSSNLSSIPDETIRYNQAVIEERLLKYKDAIESYDEVLKINPSNFKALFNKGSIYWNHYRLNESLEAYDQAVSQNPEFADAWFYRGLVLKELNQFNESASSFIKASELNPRNRMYRAYADRYSKIMSEGINPRPTFPIPLSWSVPLMLCLIFIGVYFKRR